MHSPIVSRRILAFAFAYLLIGIAGMVGAYLTQGAASAFGTMAFMTLFSLPTFKCVHELEKRRVERNAASVPLNQAPYK